MVIGEKVIFTAMAAMAAMLLLGLVVWTFARAWMASRLKRAERESNGAGAFEQVPNLPHGAWDADPDQSSLIESWFESEASEP